MDKKRVRAPNFTPSDNLLLCNIIEKCKHVIENKKTDGANLLKKQQAWEQVTSEYNSSTKGYARTTHSLVNNYKNLKKKVKKQTSNAKMDIPVDRTILIQNVEEHGLCWEKVAEGTGESIETCQLSFEQLTKEAKNKEQSFKKTIMGTGGGPPPKDDDDDPLFNKIKGLAGPSLDGLYTIYDGDSELMALQGVEPIETTDTGEQPSQVSQSDVTLNTSQDDTYFTNDRANLKKKPHNLLTRKRRLEEHVQQSKQTVSDKFKELASCKLQIAHMQKELLTLQLTEEREKLEHNRLIRSMELEHAKIKFSKSD